MLLNAINSFVTTGRVFSVSDLNAWDIIGARTISDTVTTLVQWHRRVLSARAPTLGTQNDLKEVEWSWSGGSTYKGQSKDRQRHGYGVYVHPNGNTYEGEYQYNERHGVGKGRWPTGATYEGQWANNCMHGYGVFTGSEPGVTYQGALNNHLYHGFGVKTWANGRKYEGHWANNNMHGFGVNTWATGTKYEGEWANDLQHGHGVCTWRDGQKCEGEWKNDDFEKGEQTRLDGTKVTHKGKGKG